MTEPIKASDLSDAERCFRLVQLQAKFEPARLPVREGIRRHFDQALRLMALQKPLEDVGQAFEDEAAERGFEYPEKREVYTLAKDYGCWLDGAVRLVQELGLELTPTDPRNVAGNLIDPGGYYDQNGTLHFFRVTSSLDSYSIHWPEMIAMATENAKEAIVHRFRLPASVKGRVPSPLVLCYEHPVARNQKRLARLGTEPERAFNGKWKRIGRWELEDVDWPEWRRGIDKDDCMRLIVDETVFTYRDVPYQVLMDAGKILKFLENPAPKKHETCGGCMFNLYCHGKPDDRRTYLRRAREGTLLDQVEAEVQMTDNVLHT